MARFALVFIAIQLVCFLSVNGLFFKPKVQDAVKYRLKQKVLTLGSSYTVKDDKGEPVYKVKLPIEFVTLKTI